MNWNEVRSKFSSGLVLAHGGDLTRHLLSLVPYVLSVSLVRELPLVRGVGKSLSQGWVCHRIALGRGTEAVMTGLIQAWMLWARRWQVTALGKAANFVLPVHCHFPPSSAILSSAPGRESQAREGRKP